MSVLKPVYKHHYEIWSSISRLESSWPQPTPGMEDSTTLETSLASPWVCAETSVTPSPAECEQAFSISLMSPSFVWLAAGNSVKVSFGGVSANRQSASSR